MNNIRELRKTRNLTQKQLAEKAGINIRLIQKYESGEYDAEKMTVKNALAVSAALECTIEEMIR